jgi:aminomethyltransferase
MGERLQRTPLYDTHLAVGARMGGFAGWAMPLWYSGVIREHDAVRNAAGLFDVSHLSKLEIAGDDALPFVQRMITADACSLAVGQSRYTLLCREDGGILDDALLYRLPDRFLLVGNAANAEKTYHWLTGRLIRRASVTNATHDIALLAVQGPLAASRLEAQTGASLANLPRLGVRSSAIAGARALLARGGYTGEDGFELFCAPADAPALWAAFLAADPRCPFTPCGLAARDILRLEAGFRLYGQDIDETTNPLEAGLGWAVSRAKGDFVGRAAIMRALAVGIQRKLVGLVVKSGAGVPRRGNPLHYQGADVGVVTSGGFSPSLGHGIALGYVPTALSKVGTRLEIVVRGRPLDAVVASLPFYRRPRPSTASCS